MTSSYQANLNIPVPFGVVSGFFFFFDHIFITIIDYILARIVLNFYYKQIFKGHPLTVRSVDIIGVTSFLIGRKFSPVNVLASVIKVVLLITIFNIDLSIDTRTVSNFEMVQLSGTYDFDASDDAWKNVSINHKFKPIVEHIRYCRLKSNSGDGVTFYKLSFNFSGGTILKSDRDVSAGLEKFSVDYRSVVCQSKASVNSKSVYKTVQVVGCSPNRSSGCRAPGKKVWKKKLFSSNFSSENMNVRVGSFSIPVFCRSLTNVTFWNYKSCNVSCMEIHIGWSGRSDIAQTCLVRTQIPEGYLVENWKFNGSSFTRRYPGAVFAPTFQVEHFQSIAVLAYLTKGNVDYESMSSIIVANSAIYRQENQTLNVLKDHGIVSIVPYFAVGLSALIIVFALLGAVVTYAIFRKDKRPILNEVNGLSSIAREEAFSTGKSLIGGTGVLVGLIIHSPGIGRLAPVAMTSEVVRRSELEIIK